MRVLLISTFFPPQHAVASQRAASIASALTTAGHAVTVLTTRKRPDQRGLETQINSCEVVDIPYDAGPIRERLRRLDKPRIPDQDVATATPATAGGSRLLFRAADALKARSGVFSAARMPDLTDAWVPKAVQWALQQPRWDLAISTSGPYTTHLVASDMRRRGHAGAWIADFRDLWTDNHLYRGLFPFTVIERRRERQCLHEADLVVTVSEGLAETLRRKTRTPVEVIYNGYDEAASPAAAAQPCHRLPEAFNIVYTGTIYATAQDPRPLIEAFAVLAQREPQVAAALRLVVAGERAAAWRILGERLNGNNAVELRGVVSNEEARRLQQAANALLVLDWNGPQRGILTAKAFDYLAADAPILAIGRRRDSSLGELLRKTGRGVHLGDDPGGIAEQLHNLVRDPGSLQLSPNRDLIASLSRQRQANRLVKLAEELTGRV